MENLRNSKLLKGICLMLAFSMVYWSCNPDSITTQNGCTVIAHELPTFANLADNAEIAYEIIVAVQDQENYQSLDSLYYEFFPESQDATNAVNKLNSEFTDYGLKGFSTYVQDHDFLSSGIKSYLLNYEIEFDSLISTEPDLNQFTSFINSKISGLYSSSSNLCQKDAELVEFYLLNKLGYAQYYYNNSLHPSSFSSSSLESRECDGVVARIACGALALIAGVVAGVIITKLTFGATITREGEPFPMSGPQRETLSIVLGIAIGILVHKLVKNWCCGGPEKDQTCYPVHGHMITPLGCNEYTIRLLGKSKYRITTWDNDNTNPAQAVTNYPSLTFSVPNPTLISTIHATNVVCVEEVDEQPFFFYYTYGPEEIGPLSTTDVFPLEWATAPPSNFTLESGPGGMKIENPNIFYTNVYTPNNNNYQYLWEVTAPNEISYSGNGATVELVSTGFVTTKVKVTDLCTNYSETIQKTTNVQ